MSTSVGKFNTCFILYASRPAQLIGYSCFYWVARKLPNPNCPRRWIREIPMVKELGAVVGALRAVFPRLIACMACAGIAGFALVPVANAVIVTNGDFATGKFAGWTLFTTPNGTLGLSGSGLPAVTSF